MANAKTIFIIKGAETLLDNEHNDHRQFISTETHTNEDADDASQHAESVYEDHGTPAPVLSPPLILRITTDHVPKDKFLGFRVGRNSDKCDILLDDARVSETHFAVQLNLQSGAILLHNHSKHGTRVTFSRQNEFRVLKGTTQTLLKFETADVDFGDNFHIQIQRYDDPVDWKQYYAGLAANSDAPSLAMLGLGTNIQTTDASKRPPVYIQDRRLGQGAFAQVFKAFEKYTGDAYAMKLHDKPDKARWQEQATLKRLQHEHIVRYVAYIDLPNQPAQLIMEYVEGPNLQDVLDPRNGHPRLSMSEACEVLRQLLEAVKYLHGMGVAHRDIKPANIILVCRSPVQTKLVDFGLATDSRSFDTHCGTPLYLAPELLTRNKRCTNKVDVFSVGVIALALFGISFDLTSARGPRDYLRAVLQQKQLLTANGQPLPAHYDLVNRLLSQHPDDRPSAHECLGHGFFQQNDRQDLLPVPHSSRWQSIRHDPDEIATEIADTQTGPFYIVRASMQSGQVRGGAGQAQQIDNHAFDVRKPGTSGSERSGLGERRQDQPSRLRPSLSSSSMRHKRQKQGPSSISEEAQGAPELSRSDAPSPSISQSDSSSRRSVSAGHQIQRDHYGGVSSGLSHHSVGGENITAAIDSISIPDTASFGDFPLPQNSAASLRTSPHSPRLPSSSYDDHELVVLEESLIPLPAGPDAPSGDANLSEPDSSDSDSYAVYDGCWLDPGHILGGGLSFSEFDTTPRTQRAALPLELASGSTPSLQPLSYVSDFGEQHELSRIWAVDNEEGENEDDKDVEGEENIHDGHDGHSNGDARPPAMSPSIRASGHSLRDEQISALNQSASPVRTEGLTDEAVTVAVEASSTVRHITMVGQQVRLDTSDGFISAIDLYEAGKVLFYTRNGCFSLLDGHGVLSTRDGEPWIPFQDAWFLCEKIGLDPNPLRPYAQVEPPSPSMNYLLLSMVLPPEYRVFWWDKTAIPYVPGSQTVNVSKLVRSMGLPRKTAGDYLRRMGTRKTIVGGNSCVSGTYVALDDARRLCASIGVSLYPIQCITTDCRGHEQAESPPAAVQPLKLPDGFRMIEWKGKNICCFPQDLCVNVTHLLVAAGYSRNRLQHYFRQHPEVPRTMPTRNRYANGTYMKLGPDLAQLWEYFDVDQADLQEVSDHVQAFCA